MSSGPEVLATWASGLMPKDPIRVKSKTEYKGQETRVGLLAPQ
jgi:hypothetical protein